MSFFLFISLIPSLLFPSHAFYVSITDIAFEEEQKELKVEIKIFTNDLEDDIRNHSGEIIQLQNGIDEAESLRIHAYLLNKLELKVDNVAPPLKLDLCKIEGDAVFSYYSCPYPSKPEKVSISSHILYSLFPSQSNIIRIKGKAGGLLKLDKQHPSGSLDF